MITTLDRIRQIGAFVVLGPLVYMNVMAEYRQQPIWVVLALALFGTIPCLAMFPGYRIKIWERDDPVSVLGKLYAVQCVIAALLLGIGRVMAQTTS